MARPRVVWCRRVSWDRTSKPLLVRNFSTMLLQNSEWQRRLCFTPDSTQRAFKSVPVPAGHAVNVLWKDSAPYFPAALKSAGFWPRHFDKQIFSWHLIETEDGSSISLRSENRCSSSFRARAVPLASLTQFWELEPISTTAGHSPVVGTLDTVPLFSQHFADTHKSPFKPWSLFDSDDLCFEKLVLINCFHNLIYQKALAGL